MDKRQMHRWVDVDEIQIPPIERPGFASDILQREVWMKDSPEEKQERPTELSLGDVLPMQREEALPEEPAPPQRSITLTRINSPDQEVIHIKGDMFTIGKSRKADYTVSGNSAISRMHLMIYRVGDDYYVEDQGSLNHTFVDEEMITGPYRLRNGLVIRMANEDFILRME